VALASPVTAILKLAAWSCLVVLGLLSLLPAAYVTRTGYGAHLEHFVAYLGTAGMFCLAYRSRRQAVMIAMGLAAAAALFELAQYVSPGRTPALGTWAVSTTGALASGVIGLLIARR
jgi:VanZ family protein